MKYYYDIIQGTPEWIAIRQGKMTASHAQAIASAKKGLKTYTRNIMIEYHSGERPYYFSSLDMERGTALEGEARMAYEKHTGKTVDQVGFVEYNNYVGCSPDGLVGKDGGIEIKCHESGKHSTLLELGHKEIPASYKWQMQMNLLITKRKWWDYVAYDPTNIKNPIWVHRVYPDAEMFRKLEIGFKVGEGMLKKYL